MPDAHNVFISYARKDGSAYAERLYRDLTSRGITAWRDTRDLDPYEDFGGEIERGILGATHVAVIITPDVRRTESFVRREIAFALEENKPIIPLIFPGGRRPVTIINHTYINFSDWDQGLVVLLERLERGVEEINPQTRREIELAYLQSIGQRYDHWRDLYTDLAATAHIEQSKVKVKGGAAARYLDMHHDIFRDIEHSLEDDKSKTVTVQSFDELREGIRQYKRVALIGDPGAGKTTTLERLAYELATEAAEDEHKPLPLFVRLGAYNGGDFDTFLDSSFGGLMLVDYLPGRVFLLLDGLNEMPSEVAPQVDGWLRRHADTPVIVTCRKLDYVGHKLPLQRVDVAPLDVIRIHLFIGNYLEDTDREELFWALSGTQTAQAWKWFRETQGDSTFQEFWFGDNLEREAAKSVAQKQRPSRHRAQGEAWQPDAQHLRTMRRLLRTECVLPGMLGVMTNPFLLFATINIYTHQGEPPTNRGQLFERFVDLLFRQQERPPAHLHPVEKSIQIQALSALAYWMQSEHTGTSVDIQRAGRILQKATPNEDVDHLLYLAVSAGILEIGTTVHFTHQLLQEYFAAHGLREAIKYGLPANHFWPSENWWQSTGWEETTLLLAGIEGDATHLVRWLTPTNPTLAYRCATESGAQCAPDVLQLLFEPPEGERRSPLASAEWGRILAEGGDTRPGVGLRPDGIPDLAWVEIPEGDFTYQRNISLFQPAFYISQYPITYRQYKAFLDAEDGYRQEAWWDSLERSIPQPGEQAFKYDNHPCENVSWKDAVAFCHWLSARLSYEVRLPSEQEWEKAARGTDGRLYPWGRQYIPGSANIDEITTGAGPHRIGQTTAVGMYPQGVSPYGALDMGGNVWEWCLDPFDNRAKMNVARGGSWSSYEHRTRATYRLDLSADERRDNVGFRVACSAPIP